TSASSMPAAAARPISRSGSTSTSGSAACCRNCPRRRGPRRWTPTGHRAQARVEDRIRGAKATGLRHLPSRNYQVNTAWCQAASIACDLLAWLRLLALDGDLATAEPKTLRYKILHTAARIAKGQRRRYLRIPAQWPWARDITQAFTRIMALPPPRPG